MKFIIVTTLILGALAFPLVFYPPSFLRVNEVVVVTPLKHLSEIDLVRLSGVKMGDNLLTLRLSKVREKMMLFPWIRDLQISKRVPGRLLVWVYEQEPVAILELQQTGDKGPSVRYFTSREGVVFKRVESSDLQDLPLITGLSEKDLSRRLRPVLSLVQSFEATGSLKGLGLSGIHAASDGGVSLLTQSPPVRLELGGNDWGERLHRFSRAWETIRSTAKRPTQVDLSYQRRIVVKTQM